MVDSDCAIDYLRNREPVAQFLANEISLGELAISSVSVFELLVGAQVRGRDAVESFLARVEVLGVSGLAARLAATEGSRLASEGNRLDAADLLIAGVALEHSLPLITRNVRHFGRIRGLTVMQPV